MSLKILISIGVIPLMLLTGFFVFRFLNNKLRSAGSAITLILYAIMLFVAMAAIFVGGLMAMGMMYDYLS